MYNVKTPLLDELVIRLKRKNEYESGDLSKAIDEAVKLNADIRKYNLKSPKRDIQTEKYYGQMSYIDGYLRALLCVNIIRSYTRMDNIRKEIKKIIENAELNRKEGR
ncbi:MAG: hypothetical protein NC253_03075 [Ruminococcus sp.]|nr:hypothetical protein [Ruminococcus sp.]MCM1380378.1 hypothetical protein [Muribaculaceae bacterium]MCM1478312.1 hypothetical protein [Muribaculaceae bacterium]